MRSKLVAAIGAAFACLIGQVAFERAASADVIDVSCTGTVDQTWSPGLKLLPRLVSYGNTTDYDSCSSSDPNIASGGFTISSQYTNSCLVNTGATGPFTVDWNDGSSSTLELTGVGVNAVGNVQVFTAIGSVTSGKFAGDQAVLINSFLSTDFAACATTAGLTALSGSSSLVLTHLL